MALTAEQRKDLRIALKASFPGQPQLELMVEDELDKTFNEITQAQPNYELTVRDLVKWAEAEGRLRDLVIGASIANAGNPILQGFVQEHLQLLLEASSHSPKLLSSNSLALLIQFLTVVTDFEAIILPACRQTLPELEFNHDTQFEQLLSTELSTSVKWLILLSLLLEYTENSENQLPLVTFVQNLQGLTDGAAKVNLNSWLTSLPAELQPTQAMDGSSSNQVRPTDEALKKLQVYFLIIVEPPEITSQTELFGINGYLIISIGKDDKHTKFQTINLRSPSIISAVQNSESGQQTKGLFCTMQQIEDTLPDWLLQAQFAIGNLRIELQKTFSLDFLPDYDLTVEFWLPFEQLAIATDTWRIYGQPVRLKRRNVVIGKEYRVVVRSYDRFSDWGALDKLNRTWKEMDTFFHESLEAVAVREKFEHVDCWDRLVVIQQQLMHQPCLGLTLTCPLTLEQYQDQRNNLFSLILDAGIPVALWSRVSDSANLQEKMHELLTAVSLHELDQLLEGIKQTRRLASDEHHLAIWFDEPKRLMELKQFLEPRRLSA